MSSTEQRPGASGHPAPDLELIVSYILIGGVFLSLGLISLGTLVGAIHTRGLGVLDYTLPQYDLFQFTAYEFGRILHGRITARDAIDLGVIVLMATPFIRVCFSWLYFAFVERNWKYTLITGFVLVVLTVALALRLSA